MKRAVDGGQPFSAPRAAPPPLLGRSFTRFFIRQWPVPPSAAAVVFDDWRQGRDGVVAPAGRLTLGPSLPHRERAGVHADEALRAVPGRLRPTRWVASVPVELSVVAWSDDVTQVELRPRGRGQRSLRMPASIYFVAGNGVLDVILAQLRARTASTSP